MKDQSAKRPKFYGVSQPGSARSEKLARLNREIEQSAYQVDSKKLADMLIVKLLLPFQNPPIFMHASTNIKNDSPVV